MRKEHEKLVHKRPINEFLLREKAQKFRILLQNRYLALTSGIYLASKANSDDFFYTVKVIVLLCFFKRLLSRA